MKVCKFGGTSMATAQSLKQLKEIILSDSERKFIVVSAPGKRFKGDVKITDLLYKAHNERGLTPSINEVKARFLELCKELDVNLDVDFLIDEIRENIKNNTATVDYMASRGEFLAAKFMAKFLGFEFIEAGDYIKFRVDGSFDAEVTNDLVSELKSIKTGAVIAGFYGRMPNKEIKTFSRGGSDVTGAIIARGIDATVYENWTDVNGFMAADPTIVTNPKKIDVLSFEELRELAYMGASVLHPESIFPLLQKAIPINIKNSFEPTNEGTMILKCVKNYDMPTVTGIAGHKGSSTIILHKAMMGAEIGVIRRILSILERHGLSFEHIPTGIDTVSLVLSTDISKEVEEKLVLDIKGTVNPNSIEVVHNMALIAVVGHGMAKTKGVAARMFGALYKADINICMIDQGSSEMNIIIGVEERDYEGAIKAIYGEFF
jgi:aspartate kinase